MEGPLTPLNSKPQITRNPQHKTRSQKAVGVIASGLPTLAALAFVVLYICLSRVALQGYLAHKKQPLPRTQQQAHAQGPEVVLGGGGGFL